MTKMNKRRILTTTVGTAMVAGAMAPAVVSADNHTAAHAFPDITADITHYQAINALYQMNIVEGYEDGYYYPETCLTRIQAALMLERAKGLSFDGEVSYGFTDVEAQYEETVDAVYEAGYFEGSADGDFHPHEELTREQMAKVIVEAYNLPHGEGVPESDFSDRGDTSLNTYIDAVAYANVAEGFPDGSFGVGEDIKRMDFSAMLYNAMTYTPGQDVTVVSAEVINENTITIEFSNGETITFQLDEPLDEGESTITVTIGGEDYTVDVTYNSETPTVEEVVVVNDTTIEVTLSNGETTTVDLDEALMPGENTIVISIDGVEHTVDVTLDASVIVSAEAVDENTITVTWEDGTSTEVDLDEDLTVGENTLNFEVDGNVYTSTVLYYPDSEFFVTVDTATTVNADTAGSVSFSGDTYPGSEVSIELEDETNATLSVSTADGDFELEDGSYETTVDVSALADGTVDYTVTSEKGSLTTETTGSFELDTTTPEFDLLDVNVASDGLELLVGTEAGAEVSVETGEGTVLAAGTADANGDLTLNLLENLDEADLTDITITVTDDAGNETSATVDLIAELEVALTAANDAGLLSGGSLDNIIDSEGNIDLSLLIEADGTLSLNDLLSIDGILDLGNIDLLEAS